MNTKSIISGALISLMLFTGAEAAFADKKPGSTSQTDEVTLQRDGINNPKNEKRPRGNNGRKCRNSPETHVGQNPQNPNDLNLRHGEAENTNKCRRGKKKR